ncbi:MAG TPA: response regulator, partial [Verrucomicrobia bacterium]|nr:response regulator [Verrucomicrobiota bacterium]
FPRSKEAKAIGIRTGFAFPVSVEKRVLGVLEFFSRKAEAPDEVLLEIVGDVGVQLGRVIARKEAEHKLHEINEELEHRVESITADLKNANEALKDAGSDLMEARDAAQAASRAKRTFLANMSHEIRTPMNAILGFTQLMKCDQGLAPENLEKVRIISRSGEHLLELINDILEVSKIEAGRVALTTATFDLSEFLRDVELMFRIPVEEKKLRFTVRKSESLPQYVVTDEGKLRQVLINLLGNALKFTEEGKITLEVLSEQSPVNVNISMNFQQAPLSLRFEVKDTGRGFAEDEMDYLFRQFEQTKSGTRSQSGTGLGLSISKKYSVMLGGDLTVSSQVGKGSVFRVTIPIIEGQRKDVPERVIHRQISGLVKDQPEFRLLVVDDEQTNRMLLSSMLTMIGFNVREANDGRQAIAVWREWAPHLIFMDISMPVMDGKEATRRIKSMEAKQETVIIAVTASVLEQDREDILSAGVDDFLPKPFREQELFEMIQSALGVRYDYEEEEPASNIEAGEESDETVLTPESMASLDPDLLKQLRSATTAADMDLIDGLINQIEDQNPKLAKGLRDLADRFEYEKLENWII